MAGDAEQADATERHYSIEGPRSLTWRFVRPTPRGAAPRRAPELPRGGLCPIAETYVHLGCPRSAYVATVQTVESYVTWFRPGSESGESARSALK